MGYYKPEILIDCKRLFIQEGLSALEISKRFNGKPSHQTIINWSKKEGWENERKNFQNSQYEKLSPKSLAEKILKKIELVLETPDKKFTTKDADALAKLQSSLVKITDSKYQIPALYQALTEFVKFLKHNYPQLLTTELLNAIRHFKNSLQDQLK